MKAIKLKYPFKGLFGYKQLRENGRMYLFIWDKKKNKKWSTSLARYRLSVHLKRKLKKNEHVDHKDGDFTNDKVCNLQILSQADNNRKRVLELGLTTKPINRICPVCKKKFSKPRRQLITKLKNGKIPTCSRSCGGKWSRRNK